ncbi:MauE/DoxX family redox-associated membrane protein [Luteolibacter marinus]|uniref:MauE/DoxX family redox-associated membrane protein n=1 Tax=Luteolibacter marinus TaxID=2776705 RepID=UPI0018671A80
MAASKLDEYGPGVALVLRLQLGGYFVWSGWMKVFHTGLDEFTRAVGNYKLVGEPWDAAVAYTVPWVEMVVGLCLVAGLFRRGALLILAGLVGVFAVAVGHAWRQNLNIACGCTGNPDGTPMDYTLKFVEFGVYWLVIALIWFLGPKGDGHVFGGTRLKLPGR